MLEGFEEIDAEQQLRLVDRAAALTSDPFALDALETLRLFLEG